MMQRFDGKTILVTGGAMGIGRATVRRLLVEGATVIVADVNRKTGQAVVDEATSRGGNVSYVHVDLAVPASIEAMGREVAVRTPVLHGLVNNCAIIARAMIADTGDADWEPQMSVNLRAPALCAKAMLPLLAKGSGSIVNISSEIAFRPLAEHWVYAATKSAVRSLTRSMACEFQSLGIRANCIAPGWTVTEMHYAQAPDPALRKKELEDMHYDGAIIPRLGRPEEMAAAIAFLLSDDASYITATTLHVDGGRVAY
jgi:3-oxoacyl-[acyl-carrier protein] reductase